MYVLTDYIKKRPEITIFNTLYYNQIRNGIVWEKKITGLSLNYPISAVNKTDMEVSERRGHCNPL